MYNEIRMYVMRYTLNDNRIIDDIVQEVFIEAFLHIDNLIKNENYRGWIYNTAKYKIKKYRYKVHRIDNLQTDLEYIDKYIINNTDTYDIDFDEYKKLLSDEEKKLLVKHFKYGLTYVQIAEDERIEIGTCKMRVHRIIKKLRKHLYLFDINQ